MNFDAKAVFKEYFIVIITCIILLIGIITAGKWWKTRTPKQPETTQPIQKNFGEDIEILDCLAKNVEFEVLKKCGL